MESCCCDGFSPISISGVVVRAVLVFFLAAATAVAQTSGEIGGGLDSMSLEQLMELRVRTATLSNQSLQDAPASVTVVTAEDIRRYGYRTLGEVLSNVRSFYATFDGALGYVGARGFSLPGDYNTRFLVLVNGHPLTDNVYSAMYYFGEDFPLDLELVNQIEIVRGPSSALYGGNGLFATINIITHTPASAPRKRLSAYAGTLGEKKLTALSSFPVGSEARMLLSTSVLHSKGRSVHFPELEQAGLSPSSTDHVGAGSGYRVFANLAWKDWSVTALFGQHRSIAPAGWFGTPIGNTGTVDLESRNFVEAAWSRPLGHSGEIAWRTSYDQYRYDGVYDYGNDYRNLDGAIGDWVGSQFVYHHHTGSRGTLTVGAEGSFDLRNVQYNVESTAAGAERLENFRISRPRTSYGFFAQQELRLSPSWTGYFGGRLDATTYDDPFFSPRAALIYSRNHKAYKLMYGRAFRNPSTFERYWEPNPALEAERIDTFEMAAEQRLHRRVNLVTSVFHYRLGGLIVGVPITESGLQYQNASRAHATGLEMEVNARSAGGVEAAGGFSVQRTREGESLRVQNSPVRLAFVRASLPLPGRHLILGGAVRHIGARLGAFNDAVPPATLVDLTLTSPRLGQGIQTQLGIRNLLDVSYSDPLSAEHMTQRMPAAGRSVFLALSWLDD